MLENNHTIHLTLNGESRAFTVEPQETLLHVLLDRDPHPTREEIHAAMSGNLCRCTGYTKIEEAIVAASKVIDQYANGKGAQQ